jgi:hypothetical protein
MLTFYTRLIFSEIRCPIKSTNNKMENKNGDIQSS